MKIRAVVFSGCFQVVMLVLLTGCAMTPDRAHIVYTPRQAVSPLPGADKINVRVALRDSRPVAPNQVGHKSNVYGMEMAAITSVGSVPDMVTKALEQELENSGFKLDGGDAVVNAEISRLYNRWVIGFWSGTARAEFNMKVDVTSEEGSSIIYSRMIYAEGLKDKCQLTSGANAEIALSAALTKGIHCLMEDPEFTRALFKAAKQPADQSASASKSEAKVGKQPDNASDLPAADSTLADFQRLKQLKAAGLITDEEFEKMRKRMADRVLEDDSKDTK
jgi:uncharacterized lipoprotein YajG